MPEDNLDDGLRALADGGARRGRLPDAPVVRQRGDARRRRRHAVSATLGVALVGLFTVGVTVGRPGTTARTAPAAPPVNARPFTSAPATPTVAPVLSGTREVTIVRVQATEGAIALDGNLTEVDDDSGRQLFVPTPLGDDTYLIKAYGKADNHPANDEPACWQVTNPGNSRALTVEGTVCDPTNPAQRFTITASGTNAYAISNRSAYLQRSSRGGMILEELGDGPLRSTFRLVDSGPARRPAGG
ncbi:RICIN domain-containing protein [Micromonospora chokoriensis]